MDRHHSTLFRLLFCVCGALAPSLAHGGADLKVSPSPAQFGSLPAGDTSTVVLQVVNRGDSAADLSSIVTAGGASSPFLIELDSADLATGDTLAISVRFTPINPGGQADVLILSDETSGDKWLFSLSGTGQGPNLVAREKELTFNSPGIGLPDTVALQLLNTGTKALNVTEILFSAGVYKATVDTLEILVGGPKSIPVVYTPDGTAARTDTLTIISDDFDEGRLEVVLSAVETPQSPGKARISLTRLDTVAFPKPGDTISIGLLLKPNGDSMGGVESFIRMELDLLEPVFLDSPAVRTGSAANALALKNRWIQTAGEGIVHYSFLLNTALSAEGEVARLNLLVKGLISEKTKLQVLTREGAYNSNYITSSLQSFTLVPDNHIALGNTPPQILSFPIVDTEEDPQTLKTIALDPLVFDSESPKEDLKWAFFDPSGLVTVSVDSIPIRLARFILPKDANGTFVLTATVSDPAGAADTTLVVLDVTPTNDPPTKPTSETPADGASGLEAPYTFQWSSEDPDDDGELRYEFWLGPAETSLKQLASNLASAGFEVDSFGNGTEFFWRVFAVDQNFRISMDVQRFTTTSDKTSPAFTVSPRLQSRTSSTARIIWESDEPTKGQLKYGPEETFDDSTSFQLVTIDTFQTSFTVELSALQDSTSYSFVVRVEDAFGNETKSLPQTFMTIGISGPLKGDFDGNGAIEFADFISFAATYGTVDGDLTYTPVADFDDSGNIGFEDFIEFAKVYGTGT